SPPGEPIGVRVEDAPRGAVRVVVEDAGPGVPPAERDKIFARFYTTDREGEGTGLGLAIVRAVAEAHGGRVEVGESARGGARFVMTLPIARGPR
ncbi:MAG TPA: HAMP domain-containing sensor histidine kinase, partial [Polyangiaceae bacterium LLY-WYZ-15_(1-7)]|nr:HAMP domain-containing sensor histidine kinase [Polyangiaceae bacterium LLY-WYZ-15_(1-7)]